MLSKAKDERLPSSYGKAYAKRAGIKDLTQVALLPEADAAAMVLSQQKVLSSKTIRSRVICGAPCMGHADTTWFSVCLVAWRSVIKERDHICA